MLLLLLQRQCRQYAGTKLNNSCCITPAGLTAGGDAAAVVKVCCIQCVEGAAPAGHTRLPQALQSGLGGRSFTCSPNRNFELKQHPKAGSMHILQLLGKL
jgi:hypothetical protein